MAHNVICLHCKKSFDRDKEPYAKVSKNRYAHAKCALNVNKNIEIIDPTDFVNCLYCKELIRKTDKDVIKFRVSCYAHKTCKQKEDARPKTDEEKLHLYIIDLFNVDAVPLRIKKQITQYIQEYNYTYSGILGTLKYCYEIKKMNLEKANGGIGIVPYLYSEAKNYYTKLNTLQNKNKDIKKIEKVKITEIRIKAPKRVERKRKLFTFLDEEVNSNGQ